MDGKISDGDAARVPVTDHGLLYGDGIFEGIRVRAGRVFRLEQHLARLARGAKAVHLELPLSRDELRSVVCDTVAAHAEPEAYVRLVVTRGEGPLGVDPTACPKPRVFCIVASIQLFSDEQRAAGLSMMTASLRRPSADVLDPNVKSLNYMNSVMAKLEARQAGADEALLLNAQGHIAEAAVANVFLLHGRTLSTPPVSDGCLPGINRRAVMELAAGQGLEVVERSLTRYDVFAADEMFLTGSGAGVVGVRSLDGRAVGRGSRGPVTAELEIAHRHLGETEGDSVL